MKRIAIFTMGTRGDIQPYIILAKALSRAGNKVYIGTHPCWKELVYSESTEFIPIGPNINIEHEASVIRGKTKNPMISMLKTMKFVFNIIQNSTIEIYEACKNKDLVIVSHSQMGATEAEALNIETINVTLQVEMIPQRKKVASIKDKLFAALINPQMVKPYNKIRKIYNLNPVKSLDEVMSKKLNLIPISQHVIKTNPFWEEQHKLVGYWFSDDQTFTPSKELKSFLATGSKPIILSLGAMSFENKIEKDKLDLFVQAFVKTGKRALIQGFNKSIEGYILPDTMMKIDSIPHSWLFNQGCYVIHHCGFGTSVATMIYGIPSIPIPHVLDQFAFAQQLHNLGVAVSPIKASDLNIDALIHAIEEMDNDYKNLSNNVTLLSKKLIQEDGLSTSVALVQEILANQN